MQIYLASRYRRHVEMQGVSAMLTQLGHVVTARWILGEHRMPDCAVGTPDEVRYRQQFAAEDLDDLRAADCCISFTEEPRAATRGGRHTEFGIALERGQRVIVVGPREHVFHWLPQVQWYPDHDALALALMTEPRQAREAVGTPLELALQSIFGGRPRDIIVSHIDQITPTLMAHQVELLLRAAGGAWVKLLERIALCRASAALAKNPGEDPRLKPEKKAE